MHQIIDVAVMNILAGAAGQQLDDIELGQGQLDRLAAPQRAARVAPERQRAIVERGGLTAIAVRQDRPHALGDQLDPFQDDRQAARLVDEIDGAAFERRLFIDIVAERGQKDDGNGDDATADLA